MREVLLNDNTIKDETRRHLQTLKNYGTNKKRKSIHNHDDYNEINSTGSFLSDLSLTQSEDDFLDSKTGPGKKWKKHRVSYNNNTSLLNASAKKTRKSTDLRRSTRREFFNQIQGINSLIILILKFIESLLEYGPNDKIIAQTKVSIPQDKKKPIQAESIIESIPQNHYQNHVVPSTPTTTSVSSGEVQWKQKEYKVQKENKETYKEYREEPKVDPFKTPMK